MKRKRILQALAVAVILCAGFLLHRADRAAKHRAIAATAAITPVGTWAVDNGNFIQFRADGTGRSRDPTLPGKVMYFEWSYDGSTLTLSYAPRGNVRSFIAHQLGVQTDAFAVQQLSPRQMTVTDGAATVLFTPTDDDVLDADP